ncbi:hypothetical protein [Pseudodesulfovibrio pelocollis]|uniref:hypothetical protein n=1 Tax=Pseudodesulfovibrio pelocollis TaxID=3051432 RepID=UPI00255B23BD|nr:hypothetical protein [Pseudodesulfovibrio sp. SB368]
MSYFVRIMVRFLTRKGFVVIPSAAIASYGGWGNKEFRKEFYCFEDSVLNTLKVYSE